MAAWINAETVIHIAHLCTVIAGSYILFVKFKGSLLLNLLFSMTYFMFFEYGILDRGYFLVIFFAFWAAHLISVSGNRVELLGLVFFLLCQTEVYGVFMGIALGFYIFSMRGYKFLAVRKLDLLGLIAGIVVFVFSVFPRDEGHILKTQGHELSVGENILTSLQGHLSNTYMLGVAADTFTYGFTLFGLLSSVFCVLGLAYIFHQKPKLLWTYGLYLFLTICFSIFIFKGGVRQWGMGFVFLIAMVEIRGIDLLKDKTALAILVIFSLFGIVHNVKAVMTDRKLPFTNAEKAGLFIKQKVPAKVPVVAINKFEATPVIGYAGRKFYELPQGIAFSYFRWVEKIYLPTEEELLLFARYKGVGGIVIISPKPLDSNRFAHAQLWQKFDGENYKKENYFIYTLAVK